MPKVKEVYFSGGDMTIVYHELSKETKKLLNDNSDYVYKVGE